MPNTSAGILMYHFQDNILKVLLVHPGGPYWAKKDLHSWSVPKGLYEEPEDPLEAAKREFREETGFNCDGDFKPLNERKQPSGKKIIVWAVEGDCDADAIKSNTFMMEWPPHSGRQSEFPEVDRAGWFTIQEANEKILKGQAAFLRDLCSLLSYDWPVNSEGGDDKKSTKKTTKKSMQPSLF